jgi:hypothetical protein
MRFHRSLAAALVATGLLAGPHDSRAAADKTPGMALMSAVVTYNGQLVRGSGVLSVSNVATGRYLVSFDRNISDCTWVVNTQFAAGSFAYGDFGPNNSYGADQLLVVIDAISGATSNSTSYKAENDDFNLIVFCAK